MQAHSTRPTMKPVAKHLGHGREPGRLRVEVGHGLGDGHDEAQLVLQAGSEARLHGRRPVHQGGAEEAERLVAEGGELVGLLRGDEDGVARADLGDLLAEQRLGAPVEDQDRVLVGVALEGRGRRPRGCGSSAARRRGRPRRRRSACGARRPRRTRGASRPPSSPSSVRRLTRPMQRTLPASGRGGRRPRRTRYAPPGAGRGPRTMVDVAQLVELLVVVQAVVGSSPIVHPSRPDLGRVWRNWHTR